MLTHVCSQSAFSRDKSILHLVMMAKVDGKAIIVVDAPVLMSMKSSLDSTKAFSFTISRDS